MLLSIFLLLSITFLPASMFTVTDKNGQILHQREIKHTPNAFIMQKATEFSYQAIYDELHKQENLAKLAAAAREHIESIQKKKEEAEKRGETYQLTAIDKVKLIQDAKYFRGGKYVWGGTTPEGFDCSGYVQYLYKKHNIDLPRTAWSQSQKGETVDITQLKKGDLLFFNTDKSRGIPISHVGIYIENGQFIHAASKQKGIIISPLAGFYQDRFVIAKRIEKPKISHTVAMK